MNNKLHDYSKEIQSMFKSLTKSGRPDVYDDSKSKSGNISSALYVDLLKNNYILNQALDDSHTIFKGRRGTGKSTIFLKAESEIKKKKNAISVYINLQTCYEQLDENVLSNIKTQQNFLIAILKTIEKETKKFLSFRNSNEFDDLFNEIKNGNYFNASLKLTKNIETRLNDEGNLDIQASISTDPIIEASIKDNISIEDKISYQEHQKRILAIGPILQKIEEILEERNIKHIYLFLDDFSELNKDAQQLMVNNIIAPIISSYNRTFKVKLAAYPDRLYLGNIDTTKIHIFSLDFYDIFAKIAKRSDGVEDEAIDYIKRTLEKRLDYFTNSKIKLNDLFDISDNYTLDNYLKLLFDCSSAIPRVLGFILDYCYVSSINEGKCITESNIKNSAIKYYNDNIYADFINDNRFKQSFHDDNKILDLIAQKQLMEGIIKDRFDLKRDIISKYHAGELKNKLYLETLENNKTSNRYWLPTSHFYIDKEIEKLLGTLELGFIINKIQENTNKIDTSRKDSVYALNYGLCLKHNIDYGKPDSRRSYDYWRAKEFDLTNKIPKLLSEVETIVCKNCNKVYTEEEFAIYESYKNCFSCSSKNTVERRNRFKEKVNKKIDIWKESQMPDIHVKILRHLYNNKDMLLSAFEIAQVVDTPHIVVTTAMTYHLVKNKYVEFIKSDKRYYKITNKAVSQMFSEDFSI